MSSTPLYQTPLYLIPGNPLGIADDFRTLWEWINPGPISAPPQSSMRPAAPRSNAEMTSGRWTPEDARTLAEQETVRDIIRFNDAAAGRYSGTPVIPNPPPGESNSLMLILGAVAVTGIGIAIFRR